MAGFSCSAILTLYLTAIVFLQGADLSLETKATQDLTMPSRSNSSGAAFNKPLRIISPHNEKSENTSQIQAKQGCANCSKNYNEKNGSDLHNLRIEMIKAKLLAKLQLEKEPVLKHKPKELRIAALLSNLNLIEEENDENEPEYDEDEYYGKTTQIILFSEKAKVPVSRTRRNFSRKLRFYFKLEENSVHSSVSSAVLWLHMRKSKKAELEGRFLHIVALNTEETMQGNMEMHVQVVKSIVKKEKKSGSGWIVVEMKEIVQHWFNKASPTHFNATHRGVLGLEISCQDCERDTSQLISSRGPLRPFVVIDLNKPKALRRTRRQPIDCVGGEPASHCCRRTLFVNFTKIGWDSWIIYPTGFNANFCEGRCDNVISPIYTYSYLIQEMSKSDLQQEFSICCTPSKMSGLSILYFDDDERVMKQDVPNMRVDACGCS